MISLRDVVTGFGNRDPLAEVWRRSLRGSGGGSAVITGVPPLRYIGDGRPLTDYLISGNTVQDGTPTPENPVPVVGCGTDTEDGYKLPPTINGTEYPIYLGTVPTTRRIKKLVLTGGEAFTNYTFSGTRGVYVSNVLETKYTRVYGMCTHYPVSTSPTPNSLWIGANDTRLYFVGIRDALSVDDANDVKSWVAAQYANGTPVTVWYVLAEPETAVVNEPLMKIGDYADTVSAAQAGVTIPTVSGANFLDVPTEVKPSEITIKGGIRSV